MTAAEGSRDSARYGWSYLLGIARRHRRTLVGAHFIAAAAVLFAIPIPLLMPLLVDEVLLGRPGMVVATLNGIFPGAWHGPVLYVCAVLVLTVVLRLVTLTFAALEVRKFTQISKDMVFHMRRELLGRLERISMAEYETLGSGGVASHFVTDMDAVDSFAYGHGPLVLDRLSLAIAAGDKVALVGASGGGKSTLVQVLLGLYPPVSGELRSAQPTSNQHPFHSRYPDLP